MRAAHFDSAHFPYQNTVIARFMRATHGNPASKIAMGGPDKPGHDDFF
jgi:hypothetical protein